ncbi:MAG: 2-phosphosulfolactate phosphatase [Synergistaceae bacterium]|nr:2-phosphosulfolactate phosphatase [Synergistaceae bacterium]
MKYIFDAAFLPCEALKEHDVRIVVDLLRATTQITTFFDMGGEVLIPVTEVDTAFEMKEKLGEDWKIMGERGGLPAPGFDFGNSPVELQNAGAPDFAIITTSNGTRALMRASEGCERVLAGCARNAEAVAWDAICSGKNIGVLCAGRNGEFSLEDTVCAGMLVEKMLALAPANGAQEMELTDGAMAAMALWHHFGPDITALCQESAHGKILSALGFDNDLFFCGETDSSSTVPVLKKAFGVPALVGR